MKCLYPLYDGCEAMELLKNRISVTKKQMAYVQELRGQEYQKIEESVSQGQLSTRPIKQQYETNRFHFNEQEDQDIIQNILIPCDYTFCEIAQQSVVLCFQNWNRHPLQILGRCKELISQLALEKDKYSNTWTEDED